MKGPLRLGIVGAGKIARDQHIPAISGIDKLQLVAAADPAAVDCPVPVYPDLDSLLAGEPEIEAFIMCQPPQTRGAAARAALLAGKHVFLEKPPATTKADAEALVELAGERGLTLFAAWHSRAAAGVAGARDFLADAQILSAHIVWKEDVRVWHPGQRWIWCEGGFGVFDPGINALSILTEILPEAVAVRAAELHVPANCAAPIAAELALESESGIRITAEFDFRQTGPQSWDIVVETSAGMLLLAEGGKVLRLPGQNVRKAPDAEYPALYRHFINLVDEGGVDFDLKPLVLVEEALAIGTVQRTEPFYD